MPDRAAPNGVVFGVEVRWCPACHADRTVEMVRLASDPEPVAVCTDCGTGLDAWLTAELVDRTDRADRLGKAGRRRRGASRQGAA